MSQAQNASNESVGCSWWPDCPNCGANVQNGRLCKRCGHRNSDGEHTHTRGKSRNQSIPETAREIARTLYRNHTMPVPNEKVELTIEDIGGADERTLEQYRSQLKKRGLLYEHPVSAVWTNDKEQFVEWVENATVQPDIHEVTKDYGMSTTEYTEIAEQVIQ